MSKEQDPYKYFQAKLKGAALSDSSDDQISEEKQQSEYSMNDDKDFSLSITQGKNNQPSKSPGTSNLISKMSADKKAEIAKAKADEEFKKLQLDDSDSDSSADNKKQNKTKKMVVVGNVTDSDDFSAVSSDHINQAVVQQVKQKDTDSDDFDNSIDAPVPINTVQKTNFAFSVHNNTIKGDSQPGNSTVNKGSVVPQAKNSPKRRQKSEPQSPGSAERQLNCIDQQLRQIPAKFSPSRDEEQNKIRPKSGVPPKANVIKEPLKRPSSSKIVVSDKNPVPSHVVTSQKPKYEVTSHLVVRSNSKTDINHLAENNPRYKQAKAAKDLLDKQRAAKYPIKSKENKPKNKDLNEFQEIKIAGGDQAIMGWEAKPQPKKATVNLVTMPIKVKGTGLPAMAEPQNPKEKILYPEYKLKYQGETETYSESSNIAPLNKNKNKKKVNNYFNEEEIGSGDQSMPSQPEKNLKTETSLNLVKLPEKKKSSISDPQNPLDKIQYPQYQMRYMGQSENEIYSESGEIDQQSQTLKTKGKKSKPKREFDEQVIGCGDQSLPGQKIAAKKPQPLVKQQKLDQNALERLSKPSNAKDKIQYPTYAMRYLGPSETQSENNDFGEEQIKEGDQCLAPVQTKYKSKPKKAKKGEFDEESIGGGDQGMPGEEEQATPASIAVESIQQSQISVVKSKAKQSIIKAPMAAFGSNPNRVTKPTWEEMQEKGKADHERFQKLKKEEDAKKALGNPALNTFMAQMQQKVEKEKAAIKFAKLNPKVNEKPAQIEIKLRQPDFSPPRDKENQSKEFKDLQLQLKQLFFENKTIQNNTLEFEADRRRKTIELENVMKEKKLVRIHGQLQASTETKSKRQKIKDSDIPDYEKIKEQNPFDSIVEKLEANGYTAQQAFDAFDWDGDEVLTISEIKDGLAANSIILQDPEWKLLVDTIDANCDGVLTCEEWVNVLEPKLDAQRGFINLMKDIDINDPLDLEERILDIQFKKRRLDNELRVMRRQRQQDNFFKNDKIKDEHKVVIDRIKELEQKVKDKQYKQDENQDDFETQFNKAPQNRADLEQELQLLRQTKKEQEIKLYESEEKHQNEIFAFDQRFRTINELSEMVRQDREIKRIQLEAMKKQLINDREMEKQLEKQIEIILGRAVTQADLDALYQQDLKLLNQIQAGLDNKIESYKQIIAAMKLQKVWRGKLARNKILNYEYQKPKIETKVQVLTIQKTNADEKKRRLQACIFLQRAYRRYLFRKRELERLKKRNSLRRYKNQYQLDEQKRIFRELMLIKKVQRFWRARQNARKSGSTISNPFKSVSFRNTLTIDKVIQVQDLVFCITCKNKNANRLCNQCGPNTYQCDQCYYELHSRGQRKRHSYQKVVFISDSIQLRENTFQTSPDQTSLKTDSFNQRSQVLKWSK